MIIHSAKFVVSNTDVSKCPDADLPEYAFIGRSNVGKSSLINALTNHGSLAKISSTPGKTQLINHFLINEEKGPWYLVDLPGYGYAKTSKKNRVKWKGFIQEYLQTRSNLMCVMVLLDSRHDPQKIDLEFMEWLGTKGIPFVMVFTKIDKMSSSKMNDNLKNYQRKMLQSWEFLPRIFTTSGKSNAGTENLLSFIEETNALF